MGIVSDDALKHFKGLIDQATAKDEPLRKTFENMHQGYLMETLRRFLKAREGNVAKANKMLLDCLNWRIQSEIDNILAKPIIPSNMYRAVRDSQLIGLSGYSKEGLPVFAIGVGMSTFDKASVHYYVQSHIQINEYRDRVILPAATHKHGRYIGTCLKVLDMTGLKLSALNHIKLLTIISTIDDLNYPEKTDTYYIVNVPYIFSACWKVRVKRHLFSMAENVLTIWHMQIMDYSSLPHFSRREGSGSSKHSIPETDDCFSLDHGFHQKLYDFIKKESSMLQTVAPIKQGSFHVNFPEPNPEGSKIAQTIESEFHRLGDQNTLSKPLNGLRIGGD
ncbi:phosphatidylinositol/phosphatidylcholine transfer protein SFH2 [Amborella trichopoda]|nr:phosphatidylinositol/phosphatidylcholine transfer protein SFH2 [Amborella trichopoda]|eukprot:XP_020531272.1 phosphatidylinositol/phosphatidylcholine transfer protein SFH2 [Amborella trichopoda]